MSRSRRTVNYAECKGPLRHAWYDHDGSGFAPAEFGVAMHFMCERCGTVRRDIINRFNGELLTRRYYYPEGYKDTKETRPTGHELRILALKQQAERQREARAARKKNKKSA